MKKLVAEGISKRYGERWILRDVSLELHEREIVCLLGVSGAGKTTLFNILSGLLLPEQGKVWLQGENITGQAGHISYMLQKDLLLPYRRVLDNVALPLILRGEGKKNARARAAEHFEEFGLAGTEKCYPGELSGGMRQRAALLRTYLSSQGVALLDEPFSALDTITKGEMHRWYLDVMGRIDLSTLFITHDIDEALLLSDRIYVITGQPGRITDELCIAEPRPRGQEFLLTERFLAYKRQILGLLKLSKQQ